METSDLSKLVRDPLVSVLMITYNHAAYLAAAIEGVVKQQADFPFELIIGEDNSNDQTRAIALEYQQRYPAIIRVITSEKNVGAHANAQRILEASLGKYIAFCEGDDYWCDTGKLAAQIEIMERDPEVGVVHTNFHHVLFSHGQWWLKQDRQSSRVGSPSHGRVFERLVTNFDVQTCTIMARRNLVVRHANGPLNDPKFLVGDWPLMLDLAAWSKVHYLDRSTAVYRSAPGSWTTSGASNEVHRKRIGQYIIERVCAAHHCDPAALRRWRAFHAVPLLNVAALAEDAAAAREAIAIIKENDPLLLTWRNRLKLVLARIPFAGRILKKKIHIRMSRHTLNGYLAVPDAFPCRIT